MSVGGIVGAVAGGIIGSFFPVVGTAYGASLGYAIGGGIDAYLNQPKTQGPRLEDLKIQTSSYGVAIPTKYGSGRQAGNVIWQTPLVEHKHEDSSKGGPTNTTFSYTFDAAVGICVGPIIGISRIWANKKVVYDSRPSNTGPISDPMLGSVRVYLGDETQTADPLITAIEGPSPGYRGLAYVVLEGVDGTETRGRIMWEFEVVASGAPEVSHTNICQLSDADQGIPAFRGESWIAERTIVLWRKNGTDLNSPLAMFRSVDGGPAQYVGDIGVAPGTSSNRTVPVNTRDQCFIAYTQLIFDPPSGLSFETLTLVRPFSDDEKATFNIAIGAYSGSNTFSADNMVVAYDQDDDVAAIATRSTSAYIYSGTIGIFKGGAVTHFIGGGFRRDDGSLIGGYPFRTAAGEVCCGLACANGKVFALIWTGAATSRMDLLVISSSDGSLIDTFTGPVAGIDYGDITESIRTDGTSVWAYAPGPGLVWKWGPDGTYRILSQSASPGTQVNKDAGVANTTLGGNMMFIGDQYFVSQGQVLANADGAHPIWRHQRVTYAALTGADVPVADIIADRCAKSELLSGDIDVTGIPDMTAGFDITHAMTGRAALLPLQQAYFFEAVESDFTLKFVKRGGAIAATIPEDDRAATEDGQSLPDALKIVRFNELELPSLVDVEYIDGSADYLVGNQYERRLTKKVISSVDLKLAINLSADEAKHIAATNLYGAWLTQTYAWSTTLKYAHLEPTDVVSLPTAAAIYNVRITKKTEHATGVIDWEGVEEDAAIYTQTGTGAPLAYVPTTIRAQVRTNLSLLDIPILRDADNDPGFYAKVSPNGPAWPGAGVYLDDGSLTLQGTASLPSAVGTALTALPDYIGPNVIDEVSTLDIVIFEGTLTSVTREQGFAGQNAFLIGKKEIAIPLVADLIGTKQYRLSRWLRYRRGTEGATHAIGDRVVQLNMAGMIRINHGAGDIGLAHKYVPITFGGVFNATDDQTFTNTARGLKPFSPVDLRIDRGTTPPTLTLHRRSRLATRFLPAGVDAPLGEASERYEVDIYDGSMAFVTTLSSTVPSVQSASLVAGYTAIAFQLSETVGRGTGASLTL